MTERPRPAPAAPVESPRVLRLFRFRPVRTAFDAILREVMLPDLARLPGLEAIRIGRQGPDDLGERVNATIWASESAMVAGVGSSFDRPIFHPEFMDETDQTTGPMSSRLSTVSSPSEDAGSLIRLLFGQTVPGRFDDYVAAVEAGTRTDIEAGHGPLLLCLARLGDDRFVTLSTWDVWSTVAEATAGTLSRPRATRHRELLADWQIEHYEAVPGVPEIATVRESVRRE